MKILVIPIIMIIVILFAGIFIVDQREVAIVTNYNKQQVVYGPGVYWAIPGISSVDDVYTNTQTSLFSVSESLVTHDNYQVSLSILVTWQVNEPKIYFASLGKLQQIGIDENLTKLLGKMVESEVSNSPLFDLNQNFTLFESEVNLPEFGIVLKSGVIENVTLLNPENKTVESVVVTSLKSTMSESNAIESAFIFSQKLKANLLVEKAKIYEPVAAKSPKFFDYWTRLQIYKNMAKTNTDMPPLNELYKPNVTGKN